MQRSVHVIGVGMSPFSPAVLGPDPATLIASTIGQALIDAGLSASAIGAVHALSDSADGATLRGALRRTGLGQVALAHFSVGSGEASRLFANACQAISQGQVQSILLLGVQGTPAQAPAAASVEQLGAVARAYMARYQARRETFAMIAVKARQHAAHNSLAAFNQLLSLEQVLDAGVIAAPLTRPQMALPCSGAAALLLCSSEFALRHCAGPRIRIAAQACVAPQQLTAAEQGMGFGCLGYDVSVAAARELYEQAGRGPQEVAVCELHDSSSVSELLLYEALGFCLEGSAEKMVEDGDNTYGGNLVVNPCGGLLAQGHAAAASALAQSIELVRHLRGSAVRRQVVDARLALQHQAGDDGTVTATLFERD